VDRGNRDGNINELPWASVFDPAANARALSAIQAEGFRAASELVDRFVRIAATGVGGSARSDARSDARSNSRSTPSGASLTQDQRADLFGATDIEPLIRSWWSMVGQFLLGSVPRAMDSPAADPATLDFSNSEAQGRLDLEATVPGTTTAEVWLHNRAAKDLGEVALRCSDLLAHDGGVMASGAVTFIPAAVPMPGRSSRGIELKIEVPQEVKPGLYRGTLLVVGHPELWLPVVLTVRSSAS
jgi:hypothetical protein